MIEDDVLISRAQSGDEQAFVDLMWTYHAYVYTIVIGIVNNSHDAEDIVQEVFINTYRGLSQLEDTTKFKSWLAEVARNCARNWLRKQRVDTVSINEVSVDTLQTSESPDTRLIRDEQIELIRHAMKTLPQRDREIARAYYLDGASYDDLTRTHGLSYKAISFRLSRAKRTLAKRLQYLLNVVFVPPVITFKKISSGGFTVMKIGTIPKIAVGVIAIIVIAFIGSRQLLSPQEDSLPSVEVTASTTNKLDQPVAGIDATRRKLVTVPSRAEEPQISAEEMGQIEDFFAQLETTDAQSETATPQLATNVEVNQNTEGDYSPDSSATSESTEQSAEDVMNTYVEALKNLDFEAMFSLETAAAREETRDFLDGFDNDLSDPIARGMLQSMLSRAEIMGSEYVGDEFHFRLRVPLRMPVLEALEFPGGLEPPESQQLLAELPESDISLYKMRKEDGAWRIYKQ